jgi:hypothetical protein
MKTHTVGAWAGFLVAGLGMTGCTGAGASGPNYTRPNAGAQARLSPTPLAGQTAANAPANASAWNRQPAAAPSRTPVDQTALPTPNGTSPAMTNQPSSGITPAGGIAPAGAAPGGSTLIPAAGTAAPPGGATSNSMMSPAQNSPGQGGGVPLSAAPKTSAAPQVAVSTLQAAEPAATRTSMAPPATLAEDLPPAPPMPLAAGAMPLPPEPAPTGLSPAPVALPPAPSLPVN